jgi:hypothetical protein
MYTLFIRLAKKNEQGGHVKKADFFDNLIFKLAKSDEGENLVEGVDWKNSNFKPIDLQRMENRIYPEGFHEYQDYDLPTDNNPRSYRSVQNDVDEYRDNDEINHIVVDGEKDKFYFVLEVDTMKRHVELADLTIENEKFGTAALRRLAKNLLPFDGWKIGCSLRPTTSRPMMIKLINKGFVIPVVNGNSPVRNLRKDESGKVVDFDSDTHYLGGERMGEFLGTIKIPDMYKR